MGSGEVQIDQQLCQGCGSCVVVCPQGTISMVNQLATVTGSHCMVCGHCLAACPQQAISVGGLDPGAGHFTTFSSPEEWMPPGAFDTGRLVQLMRSRRSVRNFTGQPVALALLEDLVRIGATAPSGTNSQRWSFTILPARAQLVELGDLVARFFARLNRRAANPLLRGFLRLAGRPELAAYYTDHFLAVAAALEDWQQRGIDRLFHHATAAILVGSRPGASCPAEDALLASQNILLAAHSLGLGSCLIGYVVEAMKRDSAIQRQLKIPASETIHAVIALGYPAEQYQRVTGRKPIAIRIQPEK